MEESSSMKVNGVETRVETPIPPITKDQSLGCQSQLGVTTNSSGNEPGAGGLNNVDAKGMQEVFACLNSYVRQREALLLRMAADPSNRLVLYVLELLLNSPDGESGLPALATRLSAAGGLVAADMRALIERNGHSTSASSKAGQSQTQKQNGELVAKDGLTKANAFEDGTSNGHSSGEGSSSETHANWIVDSEKDTLAALSSLLERYPSLFKCERNNSSNCNGSLSNSVVDTRVRLTESTASTLSASLPPAAPPRQPIATLERHGFGLGTELKNGPALLFQSPTPPPKFGLHKPQKQNVNESQKSPKIPKTPNMLENCKLPGQSIDPPGLITPSSNGFSSPPIHPHSVHSAASVQYSEQIASITAAAPPATGLYVPPHKERKGSQSSSGSSSSLVAVNGYSSSGSATRREAKMNGDWRARDDPKPEKLRSDSGSGSCASDLLSASTGAGCGGGGGGLCAASPPSPSPSPSSSSSSAGSSNGGSRGSVSAAGGASKRVSTGTSAGRGAASVGPSASRAQRANGSSGDTPTGSRISSAKERAPLLTKATGSVTALAALEAEAEAIRYFQAKLARRDDKWVHLKSLAGHISQAQSSVREVVGTIGELRRFVARHQATFELQGELVSLRSSNSTSSNADSNGPRGGGGAGNGTCVASRNRPQTLKLDCSSPQVTPRGTTCLGTALRGLGGRNGGATTTTTTGGERRSLCSTTGSATSSAPTTPTASLAVLGIRERERERQRERDRERERKKNADRETERADAEEGEGEGEESGGDKKDDGGAANGSKKEENAAMQMSLNEYKAVEFVRKLVERVARSGTPGGVTVANIGGYIAASGSESIANTIGLTSTEMEAFVKKHAVFFEVGDRTGRIENRALPRQARIVITGGTRGGAGDAAGRTITNRSGRIFHLAKLWGIVDLGRHEHVFFDKSLFKHVEDLTRHFRVGESIYFNAILAPKESRAKWRATQVWKESDRELLDKLTTTQSNPSPSNGSTSSAPSTECPINGMAEDVAFVGELEDFDDDEPLLSLVGTSIASTDTIRSSGNTGSGGRLVTLATADSLSARQTLSPENNLLFATSAEDLLMSELVLPMPQPEVREQLPCSSGNAAGGVRGGGRDTEALLSSRNAGQTSEQLGLERQLLQNSSGISTLHGTDVECQTLSTGDILATKLFHEPFINN